MLYLHGLGHFHPENEFDNAFLESLDIGTTADWIMQRVGIHSRRTVLPLDYLRETKNQDLRAAQEAAQYTNAQTGAKAARMALERAGVKPEQIGMVVAGGCSPDSCIPSEAAAIACELGIECAALDMHSACSTFGLHMHFLKNMGDAVPEYVLTVVPENSTRVVDFSDRSSCILFGDCTAAAVVSTKHPSRAKIVHTSFGGAPSGAWDVVIPRLDYFSQNGSKVQKFAIKRMSQLYRESQELLGDSGRDLVYVGHQANLTMLKSVARRCEVTEDRHWFNIDQYGNQAAAGAPTVLSQRWDDVPDGREVAVIVVGSGLSWSNAIVRFGD